MASEKKILITTTYKKNKNDVYDYFGANSDRWFFRFEFPRFSMFGLRFLKQNIPEIEILEYPTWKEYQDKINEEDWDVVGFSFFLNEIHEILEMVRYAREKNNSEIWAGNYGALTESIKNNFDRIFIGYSEDDIAKVLGKRVLNDQLIHPPIIIYTSFHGLKIMNHGVLYISRGCNYHCDFCQTPVFCKKPYKISINSIENVLKYYKKNGITEVIILDENFGMFRNHTEKVVNLLDNYGFFWTPIVRPDVLGKNLENWSKNGMIGVVTSIESFNQKNIEEMSKKEEISDIISVIKKLKKMNRFIDGSYMLGFENDTVTSLKDDLKKLAQLNLDINQLCIVTPLPFTPLWNDIDKKYGIFDKDWHHFNTKYLVWNHPNINPVEMRKLLKWGFRIVYPRRRVIETSLGFATRYMGYRGISGGLNYLFRHTIHANTFNYNPKVKRFLPNNLVQ